MPFYETPRTSPVYQLSFSVSRKDIRKLKGHGNWRLILTTEDLAIGESCCEVMEDDNALVLKWNAISASNPDRWLGRYQTAA